jgi:tetratricopeptide (TPR) repeat protein
MEAYHLLGDRDIVHPRGDLLNGSFTLSTSSGDVLHRLGPDFRLDGQPPDAAEATLGLISDDLNAFHRHLGMGDAAGALERSDRALERARSFGLAGHGSLFAWCRAKAFMALGRTDDALDALQAGIAANPALQVDLRLWMALDALLAERPGQALELARNLTHETCGWRAEDLEQLKAWIRILAGAPLREPGAAGTAALSANGDPAVYTRLQAGWADLLGGRLEEALERFARDLDHAHMEEHAAGLLLAEHLAGRTLPEEARLLARCEAQPAILRLALALKSGDRPGAEDAWVAIKADRLHTANSAIFFCMLEQLARRYPERVGWLL